MGNVSETDIGVVVDLLDGVDVKDVGTLISLKLCQSAESSGIYSDVDSVSILLSASLILCSRLSL